MAVRLLNSQYRQQATGLGHNVRARSSWDECMRAVARAAFEFVRFQIAVAVALTTALGLAFRRARPVREEEP